MASTSGDAPCTRAAAIPSENKILAAVSAAPAALDGRASLKTDHTTTSDPIKLANNTVNGSP